MAMCSMKKPLSSPKEWVSVSKDHCGNPILTINCYGCVRVEEFTFGRKNCPFLMSQNCFMRRRCLEIRQLTWNSDKKSKGTKTNTLGMTARKHGKSQSLWGYCWALKLTNLDITLSLGILLATFSCFFCYIQSLISFTSGNSIFDCKVRFLYLMKKKEWEY